MIEAWIRENSSDLAAKNTFRSSKLNLWIWHVFFVVSLYVSQISLLRMQLAFQEY